MTEPILQDIADAIVRHAVLAPDTVALVWHDTEITYAELHDLATVERDLLDGLDLAPGQPVGVLAEKSPEAVALVLACLMAKRPFLLPSPALADDILATLFAQAGCATVLIPQGQRRRMLPPTPVAPPPALPEGTAFMLTTSGSTGLPKIVPLDGQAVARFADWAAPTFGIGPGRSVLNVAPLNFDLCLLDVWTTLAAGGRVVMVDPAYAANGRHLAEVIRTTRPLVVQAVPMFFGLLLAVRAKGFDSVEHVMVTGDATPEHVLAGIPTLFPNGRLRNIYGCTETNDSFIADVDGLPMSIGSPLPGVTAILVEDGRVIAGPGTGELWVHTPFQTEGYLDETRNVGKFAAHPTGADDLRYFRTGDLVRRGADGRLMLVGRADFQVKVRGVAVNTAEIEAVLLEHPNVLEAAVAALPDPVAGTTLVAAVRREPGSGLDSLALREHCVRGLPRAAVPSSMRITDEPLPKTATGKVDRTAVARTGTGSSQAERRVS